MENPQNIIRHPGKIVSIDKREIHVQILSMSACSNCHAKGFCSAADMENKVIDVKNNYQNKYQVGDEVTLILKRTKGSQAVLLGYFLPFLVVLIGLIIFTLTLESDGLAGIFSLALLAPYYIILSRFRDKIKERFDFKIQE